MRSVKGNAIATHQAGLIPLGKLRKYRSAVRNTVGLYTYLWGMWHLRKAGSLLSWSIQLYFQRQELRESLSSPSVDCHNRKLKWLTTFAKVWIVSAKLRISRLLMLSVVSVEGQYASNVMLGHDALKALRREWDRTRKKQLKERT